MRPSRFVAFTSSLGMYKSDWAPSTAVGFNLYHHRCTRVENLGEGVPEVLPKFIGGSRLSGKIAPYFGYCIFINKFFENLPLTLLWPSIIIKIIYLGSWVIIIKIAFETIVILWIFSQKLEGRTWGAGLSLVSTSTL